MEFHGRQHLEQYVADTRRMNALAAKNWVVLPAWQSTVLDGADCIDTSVRWPPLLEHAGAVDFLHPHGSVDVERQSGAAGTVLT